MGLIKAAIGAAGGVLGDQWKEFFYCDSLNETILMAKGQKRISRFGRSSNTSGEDNIISDGSRIAVNDGQCMMIVESGKIVEVCAESGEYTYDTSTEPSIFSGDYAGDLGEMLHQLLSQMKERFTFGGDAGKDQRVYYFNLKEIIGNKYGTPSEVPFKTYDDTTGLALLVRLRCFGEYSYRMVNPILFYTNVAGNEADFYDRSRLDSQLKSELLTALQPAFAKLSALRIDYSQLPGHTEELTKALNDVLSPKWRDLRGIEIVSMGMNSVKANEEDEEKIQKAQMGMTMGRPDIGLGTLVDATADSMRTAAGNEGAMGAAMGYMGMNMAGQAGAGLAQELAARQQAQAPAATPTSETGWTCSCGQQGNTGKFCTNCGKPKPAASPDWTCPSCGQQGNTGKFCMNCGTKKPED
ncbi:SPFH domain-containing protein [Megasphaera sp.]|uniref:SPFH domain-containing protein n=1 Tax=Megasphaera TaxID=906 RepID=UPI001D1ECC18|nr:SPFH domain-containing protein [Megasphaera sp.]MBS6103770.1 SPFH domain-containing protein [Megasphaera sp.]